MFWKTSTKNIKTTLTNNIPKNKFKIFKNKNNLVSEFNLVCDPKDPLTNGSPQVAESYLTNCSSSVNRTIIHIINTFIYRPTFLSISFSFSTNKTSLLTGRTKYRTNVSTLVDVPSFSLTLRTKPSLSGYVSIIFPIGHLFLSTLASFSKTTSPITALRFDDNHFWRSCKVAKNSFLHLLQNSFEICWTRHQYFRL